MINWKKVVDKYQVEFYFNKSVQLTFICIIYCIVIIKIVEKKIVLIKDLNIFLSGIKKKEREKFKLSFFHS